MLAVELTGNEDELESLTMPIKKPALMAQILILISCAPSSFAQSTPPPQPAPHPVESVVVLGTPVPIPLAESASSVLILPVETELLRVQSEQDLLRDDSSIFLEERGAGGGQADIVLRGGSFEQTLILLNGFRINDAQAAHHNLDLPIPIEAMNSIQVLHGAGSTLHGVDALSGVVDFLTAAPDHDSLLLRAGEGSFWENEESALAGATHGKWSGRATASRDFSEGFMADRDYRNENASAESWSATRLGVSDLLVASSDRSFGANQFYGDYNSWERTKGWFASARQELGAHTQAAFGYRRHTDEFVLLRNDPSVYENNHIDSSWQASLRHTLDLPHNSVLLMGLESDGDSIHSNNLGIHARNRGAGYVDFDLRPASARWNLSAGLREELFSGGLQSVLSPHLAGSLRLAHSIKLRASGGYGFRLPTYTDLYYSDPTTIGDPNLKPESAWSGEGGADWSPSSRVALSVTGFYSRQHDAIDYVRANSNDLWQAANLSGLHFTGVESSFTWIPAKNQSVHIAWTALHGAQSALNGLQSEYIFNYPVQNIHATWTATPAALRHQFTMTNTVQLAQRYRQSVYPVWNTSLTRESGRIHPYVRFANLSNTGYQEITGVNMPSRSITGGISLRLGR
jgi:iron complex outermembrane receptor protein